MKKMPWGQTEKAFKREKRKEFKELRKMMKKVRFGCAYLPPEGYRDFKLAGGLIDKAYEEIKWWWRNA